ncbi:ABC transporter substrate-binding protein [Pacificibacter marinus]|uniref:ABC transporter substrate-binding protein n=1 Tax=Pacificibacter marinus TaxID=658057 RepID=UPI001C07DEFE|nr:ABC transporter substrate-binding protein [Pacificibacter marinus]MBU2867900.1 ABC transporter substrate-binding protein [Pacificibacter marinus]
MALQVVSAVAETVTVSSCGMDVTLEQPASAIVTLDQSSTETLLGLGAAPQMAGNTYLKTEIAPQYREAWETVPLLTRGRPTAELVRVAEPDLLYAYSSYFYSVEAVGTREELQDLGVGTYISAVSCPEDNALGMTSFDLLALDYENLGRLTGREDEARQAIELQEEAIQAAGEITLTREEPIRVVWLYSVFEGTPYVAGGPSIPGNISEMTGVQNIFADVDEQWPGVSWEAIADGEPDIFILGDLSERGSLGDTVEEKIAMLTSEPGVSFLDAVTNEQFIIVPGIEMDPSIRSVNALNLFVEGLKQLGYAE